MVYDDDTFQIEFHVGTCILFGMCVWMDGMMGYHVCLSISQLLGFICIEDMLLNDDECLNERKRKERR